MSSNLKSLMGRVNSTARAALESAAGLCMSRTNYEVEIEHWLLKLLELDDSDLRRIGRHFDLEMSLLVRDLNRTVDRLKTGNSRNPVLSPSLVTLVEESWMVASIDLGASSIRTGHLLLALISRGALLRQARDASAQLGLVSEEELRNHFLEITAGSPEEERATSEGQRSESASGGREAGGALEKYTLDLTGQAREGRIDPIVGRDQEIRQMVDILMRRRQNNPILTGEAGVGKTAVVEGLACQIVAGDVPPPLRDISIRTLDLGLLQAGAGVKGEFENRLKSVISEVKASSRPIILFIDEAHTLIGAGGSAGQGDAANLLKPALARGELRTIAATTWSEYKKYFEKDAALTRRFQVVKVEEPTEEQAIIMMRGVSDRLEAHHRVTLSTDAIEDAVRLSHRYLTGRQLPDKAVSVLDTACARVAVSQCAVPPFLEDCRRRLSSIDVEWTRLLREEATGADHCSRLDRLEGERAQVLEQSTRLEAQWKEEQRLVARLLELREALRASMGAIGSHSTRPSPSPKHTPLREEQRGIEAIRDHESPSIRPSPSSSAKPWIRLSGSCASSTRGRKPFRRLSTP